MDLEKLYFRRSLTSPINWPGNAHSFFNYVGQALKLRLYTKFKPAHIWTKTRPPWLPDEMILPTSPEAALYKLESAEIVEPVHYDTRIKEIIQGWSNDDPEGYWHLHRWGWLLEQYLNGSISQEGAFDWIEKWIQQNRNCSDHAWEPFSCCERIANIFILFMQLPKESQKRILSGPIRFFILDSAYWIINHLEYYGPQYTNNHILNNGRALAIAGALTENRKVLEIALSIFKNILPVLVSENGFLRERSSHYQILVLRWILDTQKALSLNNNSLPRGDMDFISHYAGIMAKASKSMCGSDGMLKILIGDVSPDVKPEEASRSLDSLYPQWKTVSNTEPFNCAADGWFFLKQDKLEVITHQPQRYPVKYSNHGHADIASFVFLFDGQQVLTDPGRNNYTKELLSKRFLSGLFHNVPLVNGIAPAVAPFFKNWIPERYGSVKINTSLSDMNSLRIEHNGFSRLGSQIWHTRIISINGRKVEVTDEFTGKNVHEVTLCWHFAPGFNVEYENAGCIRLASHFCSVVITTSYKRVELEPCVVSFHKASDDGGWYSPCYGVVQPALTVHIRGHFRFPTVISTTFAIESCGR